MTVDVNAQRTRREVIAGALGGTAALAASTLVRPLAARADNGDGLILGEGNQETSATGIENPTPDEDGLSVRASASSGQGRAVYGESGSPEGTGVSGFATATTGRAAGVTGESAADEGQGVQGNASAAAGGTFGVTGTAASPDGTGVYGYASATTGGAIGVLGTSDAPDGAGVRAIATATTGSSYGLWAECASPSGTAVYGESQADTGEGCGVSGQSGSPDGTGVLGTGGQYGVWGDSGGTGVFGHAGALSGVFGFAGIIDMGVPAPDPAPKTGVYGVSILDSTAIGVWGRTTAGKGVRGEATTGTGVYATATSSTGTALAVVGKATFSRSKRLAIPSGASSLHVNMAGVSSSSLVFAVLQQSRSGVYVRAVVPASGSFTIYLNKAVGSSTYVAYFVLN